MSNGNNSVTFTTKQVAGLVIAVILGMVAVGSGGPLLLGSGSTPMVEQLKEVTKSLGETNINLADLRRDVQYLGRALEQTAANDARLDDMEHWAITKGYQIGPRRMEPTR